MIDAGYFAKRIELAPEWLKAPGVREICSVSHCISTAPPDWVQQWCHNAWGWYDSAADARSVVPRGHEAEYRVFAYRLYPEVFTPGGRVPLAVPRDVRPDPIPETFQRLGFDSVSKFMDSVLGLECSPLSCNSMAAEMATNECCLFPTIDAAVAGADRFAREQPEPGDYYVVEVLELRDGAAS